MPGTQAEQNEPVVTPEGWLPTDPWYFQFLADQPPPRPFRYTDQLKIDARSWAPRAFWSVGVGAIVVGVALEQWLLVPAGAAVLGFYFWLLQRVVRDIRHAPVLAGVIRTLKPHPACRKYSTAEAELPDGRLVPVAVPTLSAVDTIQQHGCAEVLLLYMPKSEYSSVIGVRPVLIANAVPDDSFFEKRA